MFKIRWVLCVLILLFIYHLYLLGNIISIRYQFGDPLQLNEMLSMEPAIAQRWVLMPLFWFGVSVFVLILIAAWFQKIPPSEKKWYWLFVIGNFLVISFYLFLTVFATRAW